MQKSGAKIARMKTLLAYFENITGTVHLYVHAFCKFNEKAKILWVT